VLYFADFNIPLALAGLQRLGSDKHSSIEGATIKGGQINPNALGIVTVLASTGLMQLRSVGSGQKSDMILMCTMLVLSALSTSRTYLACLALMIVLLIFAERGGIKKKVRLIAVLSAAITAAVVAMALLFPDTFEYFVGRFKVEDITTGRDDLMALYHKFIVDNPRVMFFGIGLQDFSNRLVEFYKVAVGVPHNSVQELIIAWGIPGLFLFDALILSMFLAARQQNKRVALINWIPLIIILFKGMAGQMLNSYYTMLAFSYAYLSLCTDLGPMCGATKEESQA
jgi:O-antigen ligase